MNNRKYLVIGLIVLIVLSLGCVDKDVSSIANSIPEVQQYLKDHPNAKITVTHWTKDEVSKSLDKINKQCDKTITPNDMYKIIVQEENLKIISWIEADNQTLICSFTEGDNTVPSTSKETDTKTTPTISTTQISPIATLVMPTTVPTTVKIAEDDTGDNKFLSFTKEIVDTISKDRDLLPSSDLPNDNYFKELKVYGQSLENDAGKYLTKIEEYSVSSRMVYVYDRYKLYLKYTKLAGEYCKLATEYYDNGDTKGAIRNLNECTEVTNKATRNLNLATEYLKSISG